jgi:hypothetical protein
MPPFWWRRGGDISRRLFGDSKICKKEIWQKKNRERKKKTRKDKGKLKRKS